jgi:hypothetical protein
MTSPISKVRTGFSVLSLRKRAPLLVSLLLGVLVWALFYPAIMSDDSIDLYAQASSGAFNDWQPPLLAVTLSLFLRAGVGIAGLMLLQCLAGVTGLWTFVRNLVGLFDPQAQMPEARTGWFATLIVVALLTPLTPLAFYLMTFWKDAWETILFLWIGALAVQLHRRGETRSHDSRIQVFCFLLLAGVALLVRHNALVVLPAFYLLGYRLLRLQQIRWAGVVSALPGVLFLGGNFLFYQLLHVKRSYIVNEIKTLDLVGLCVLDPSLVDALPYTKANLDLTTYQARYRFGSVRPLYWDQPAIVRPEYVRMARNDELDQEYWTAVRRYPAKIAEVKYRSFLPLLGTRGPAFWFHEGILENEYGLQPNEALRGPRSWFTSVARVVEHQPLLRLVSGVHLVWLLLTVWATALAAGAYWFRRTPASLFHLALLLVPLLYYLSYLLAAPGPDFRFMYPATLYMQAYTAAWVGAARLRPARKRQSGSFPHDRNRSGPLAAAP